jgi:hypothetical protein
MKVFWGHDSADVWRCGAAVADTNDLFISEF